MNIHLKKRRHRSYNFSAGPATLPLEVLLQAQEELLDWQGTGVSVMEISHRTPEVQMMAQESEKNLRQLLNISDDYAVLFTSGGARGQASAIPLNIKGNKTSADYIDSGYWSRAAIDLGKQHININIAASGKTTDYCYLPAIDQWQCNKNAAYLHYTHNETISGFMFPNIPNISDDIPLVSDMSSYILSEPIDINRFGIIYAGAQKNIAPSGITIVIIRRDLLDKASNNCPGIMNYQNQATHESMFNTPPIFPWYIASLMFKWVNKKGGVAALAAINKRKAAKIYSIIDASDFYINNILVDWRSKMNIAFTLKNKSLETLFLTQAKENNLLFLAGHESAGGIRASLYNSVDESQVNVLADFMVTFEKQYG